MNDTVLADPLADPATPEDAARVEALEAIRDSINEEIALRETEGDPYPFVGSHEEGLRCFIYEKMAYSSREYVATVQHLDDIEKWIRTGIVPGGPKLDKKPKSHLKPVEA